MTKTERIAKVVAGHDWRTVTDWVEALGDLAELSDDQIEQIEKTIPAPTPADLRLAHEPTDMPTP